MRGAIFTTVALLAAWPAGAALTNSPPDQMNFTVERPKLHWLAPQTTTLPQQTPRMRDGMDTRAWTTVVGWNPGQSEFPSAETHEGGLSLFWVDVEAQPLDR